MTPDIFLTLAILVAAVILFATDKLSVDLVALAVMAALLSSGIITAQEGIAGFSNMATVTVACMFVLSAALFKTGAVNALGKRLSTMAAANFWSAILVMMVGIGTLSAFINNTAAVAIFLPIALRVAKDTNTSPSKWLMPLSFASMFGGVCTLMGSSTNILVSSIAEEHGEPAFSMFEFAPLGLVMFGLGITYMLLFGIRLIPERRPAAELTESFGMGDYLTEILLLPGAKSVGVPLRDSPLGKDFDIAIIEIRRGSEPVVLPSPDTVLQAGDQLLVRTSVERIRNLGESSGIQLQTSLQWHDEDLESAETILVEAIIAPSASLNGKSLKESRFRNHFEAVVLALRHHGQLLHENLATTALQAGDALLIEIKKANIANLRESHEFVFVSEVGLPRFDRGKMIPTLLVIIGVVVLATMNVIPIVGSAIIGCVLIVLLGVISLEEAYESIEWRIIFMLAGVLTLGTALEKTGAAEWMSMWMVDVIGDHGPTVLVSAFYLLSSILTQAMSNNATAALLAPIAIATAESLNVDARPFLVAVTFAASASFMSPVGYQTNTLIYGPGQYRWRDFIRVGTPLNIMFWILATWLIPKIWPL